jgi:hypothetical protein
VVVKVSVYVIVLWFLLVRGDSEEGRGPYTGAGVMVVSMKEEQSERRLVRGGLALAAVPPTPRRQLFGLQAFARSRSTLLRAPLAAARVTKREAFILEGRLVGG